jgi:DNA invertase Pin-like site-specific DNA recombinase
MRKVKNKILYGGSHTLAQVTAEKRVNKLTEEEILEIRLRRQAGQKVKDIAKMFRVSQHTVNHHAGVTRPSYRTIHNGQFESAYPTLSPWEPTI